jgi:hypothetical protein
MPHEVFTPQKYVHSSTRGSAEGGTPSAGSKGAIPLDGGSGNKRSPSEGLGVASLDGGSGVKPPKKKFPCKIIL